MEEIGRNRRVDLNVLSSTVRSIAQESSFGHTFQLLARDSLVKFRTNIETGLIDLRCLARCDGQVMTTRKVVLALWLLAVMVHQSHIFTQG